MGRTPAGETRERIFRFVRDRLLAGRPPTTREVQEAFKFRAVARGRLLRRRLEGLRDVARGPHRQELQLSHARLQMLPEEM